MKSSLFPSSPLAGVSLINGVQVCAISLETLNSEPVLMNPWFPGVFRFVETPGPSYTPPLHFIPLTSGGGNTLFSPLLLLFIGMVSFAPSLVVTIQPSGDDCSTPDPPHG